ncbi:MAG: DedA family protein [Sporolactobacillus sp.]
MQLFIHFINDYGYLFLFLSLFLEMLAFPLPNELLMSYAGYLVYQGRMNLWLASLFGISGCLLGVTVTYWVGRRLGTPFFYKYGHYVHLYPERLDKFSRTFNSFGKGLLLIANFIPGVRHLIGYAAGVSRVSFRTYALFAYTGSIIWVLTFISLGVFLGPKYQVVTDAAKEYFSVIIILLIIAVILYYFVKYHLDAIKHWVVIVYRSLFVNIQSRFRLKLLILGAALVFGLLISSMFSLIDKFFHNRSLIFNRNGEILLHSLVSPAFRHILQKVLLITHPWPIVLICILTYLWILLRGQQKKIEFQMFLFLIIGGLFFSTYLPRWLSHLISSITRIQGNFSPDGGLIMTFILYAYLVYLVSRHTLRYWLTLFVNILGCSVLLIAGVASMYLQKQLPSDLLIDYCLAGIWFSFIVLCLEFWRLIYITDQFYHQSGGPPDKRQTSGD